MKEHSLIKEFKTQVEDLQEVDIGDFRRRLSLYIDRLEEDLDTAEKAGEKLSPPFASEGRKQFLSKMKDAALYENLEGIEAIRQNVLNELEKF